MKRVKEPTELEQRIIEWLIQHRSVLVKQLVNSEVVKREYSGSGYFFTLKVPEELKKELPQTIEGPTIKSKFLRCGANSIIFCSDGVVETIEVFSYDGEFPENLTDFKFEESDLYIKP